MSQQGVSIANLGPPEETNFLTPTKKWSNSTGKVFDLEEPDA